MVNIDNLTTQPDLILFGAPKQVKFAWEGDVDNLTENPVEIRLSIENASDIFFLDEDDNLVKKVFWSTEAFTTNTKPFTENLFLKCTVAQANEKLANITMKATNKNGKTATTNCTISYK